MSNILQIAKFYNNIMYVNLLQLKRIKREEVQIIWAKALTWTSFGM